MENSGIGLQKERLLEFKLFKYKPPKMDAESVVWRSMFNRHERVYSGSLSPSCVGRK